AYVAVFRVGDVASAYLSQRLYGGIYGYCLQGIVYVSVAVYHDDKIITGTITNDEGVFTLKVQQSDEELRLTFDFVGYIKEEIKIIPNKAKIEVDDVVLKENVVMLDDVVISSTAVSHKSTVEHTSINASANIASSKGSALDILSASSSVSIQNEEISIRGNKNILVLMDGVPTTITDLSTIPAANIKSIDVITNPDASYDSEGTGGIINIIMKKENAKGFSGVLAANYGFNHFVTGNAGFSYNSKKASYRFNYNTKYEDDIINSSLTRLMKESGSLIKQQMISDRYTFNNNVSLGADFRINKKNTVTVDLKYMSPKLNVKQDLHNIIENGNIINEENRHNDVTWNRDNIEAVVMYRHILKPEISDISLRGSVSKIWGKRPSYYYVGDDLLNYSTSGGSPFISNFQTDYKQKLSRGTLSAGAKVTYRSNEIYHEFYSLENENWIYSQSFSNDLLHTELIPAAYVMFSTKNIVKFDYKLGLRGEYSIVTLDSKHENIDTKNDDIFIAPSLSGTYKISDKQDLSLAFSRRIGRPTYPQLNPYMSMVDAMTYEQGNMNLHPEKTSKLDFTYNVKGEKFNLFADVYLNYTTDYISQVTEVIDSLLI
ncbi:MAG: TonB-dependent receptor, partial [Bacteroidales bacterium]|nr:TonB-dependent receptor [Bacteroidales bacterium]